MYILLKVNKSLKSKNSSCCVFLDLAKAFDTVNHDILLTKLHHYGVRGIQNDWFRSYLSNRKQSVIINNSISPSVVMKYGVPQGSILGLLLFILYINDITNASQKLQVIQFADDTCIFFDHKNRNQLMHELNQEIDKVSDWMIANALSLNTDKTNFLLFRWTDDDKQLHIENYGHAYKTKTGN